MIFSCWWRSYRYLIPCPGFPGDSDGIDSVCNLGDLGLIPGWGTSPGRGHGDLFQYSCLENPHRQRSLAGYSLQRVRHNWASKHSTAHPISEPESKQVMFSLPFPLQPPPPPPPWRNWDPSKENDFLNMARKKVIELWASSLTSDFYNIAGQYFWSLTRHCRDRHLPLRLGWWVISVLEH